MDKLDDAIRELEREQNRTQPSDLDAMSPAQLRAHFASHTAEQDTCKHIATLDTGALVLLASFMGHADAAPRAFWLIGAASIAFIVSVGGAVGWQVLSLIHIDATDQDAPLFWNRALLALPIVAGGGLVIGLLALAVFVGIATF